MRAERGNTKPKEAVMEEFITEIFGSYAGLVLSIMGVCAAIATLLPAPAEDSNIVYKGLYKVLNFIAMNIGKAKNADDAQTKKVG